MNELQTKQELCAETGPSKQYMKHSWQCMWMCRYINSLHAYSRTQKTDINHNLIVK